VTLLGSNFIRISGTFFKPIIETFWGKGYNTNPGMFLSYFLGYVALVVITIPIVLYFVRTLYRIGTNLKLSSLRFLALVWLGLVCASIALVPFAYQNTLDAIAAYDDAIRRGILVDYFFLPLGLPVIQAGIYAFLMLALSALIVGAIGMLRETDTTWFAAVVVLAATGLLRMLLSIEQTIWIGSVLSVLFLFGGNTLATIVLGVAVIVFGIGLSENSRIEEEGKTTSSI
jgi:hypothetical protein